MNCHFTSSENPAVRVVCSAGFTCVYSWLANHVHNLIQSNEQGTARLCSLQYKEIGDTKRRAGRVEVYNYNLLLP